MQQIRTISVESSQLVCLTATSGNLYYKIEHFYPPKEAEIGKMFLVPIMLQWIESFLPFPLVLLLIFSVFLFFKLNRAWSEKPNLPPSPPKLPIIGNLHQLGTLLHRSFQDLSAQYGPLMLVHMGYQPTLVVSSAEMAKEIMRTHDIAFANRPSTKAAKSLLYGCTDIGFAPYGEYWRQVRKIAVLDLFSIKRVLSFTYVREEEVASMIEEISRLASKGDPINLSKIILVLSNNIVSRCSLGFKVEGRHKFGELSRDMMQLFGAFSFGDFFPLLGWMDVLTGLDKSFKKVSRELDIFLDKTIDEHIAQNKDDDDRKDFLDILLLAQKNSFLDIKITRDNIKAILLDMFVGGSDTSSTTIEWAMSELMKNPSVMKNAQEEVRRVVGKKMKVDENYISQMEYLKAVTKETLRLHAPGPLLIPRETYSSININGYHIPPNTRVMINAWAIQRDPKLWDKAEEFFPERFINNAIDFKGLDYEYIPFGSGRRGCPAMSFGVATVELAIANLLYWFDWELPGETEMGGLDMSEAFGLTVNKRTPLHVIPISHFP